MIHSENDSVVVELSDVRLSMTSMLSRPSCPDGIKVPFALAGKGLSGVSLPGCSPVSFDSSFSDSLSAYSSYSDPFGFSGGRYTLSASAGDLDTLSVQYGFSDDEPEMISAKGQMGFTLTIPQKTGSFSVRVFINHQPVLLLVTDVLPPTDIPMPDGSFLRECAEEAAGYASSCRSFSDSFVIGYVTALSRKITAIASGLVKDSMPAFDREKSEFAFGLLCALRDEWHLFGAAFRSSFPLASKETIRPLTDIQKDLAHLLRMPPFRGVSDDQKDLFLSAVPLGTDALTAIGLLCSMKKVTRCLRENVMSAFSLCSPSYMQEVEVKREMAGLLAPSENRDFDLLLASGFSCGLMRQNDFLLRAASENSLERCVGAAGVGLFAAQSVLPAMLGGSGDDLREELSLVDWSSPDMIVGSLGSFAQLRNNLEGNYYYAPLVVLPTDLASVRFVSIYESSRSSDSPGVRFWGRISSVRTVRRREIPFPVRRGNPEELYCRFEVDRWHSLPEEIRVREEGVYTPRLTYSFLFRHVRETFELFHIRSAEEYLMLAALRRCAETLSDELSFSVCENVVLSVSGSRLTLEDDTGNVVYSIKKEEFKRAPLFVFSEMKKAMKNLEK